MYNKDHQCRLCGAKYIPYKEDIECPRCGVRATDEAVEENIRFIPNLIATMKLNKIRNGVYMPERWSDGCMIFYVQLLIFELFDLIEKENPKSKRKFIEKFINSIAIDSDLESHLKDVSFDVLDQLKK